MTADIKPSQFVLEHAPWSVSKADTAKECPKKFWFAYVVKEKRKTNVDALVGKAAHKALEYALSGRSVSKSIDFAIEEYELTSPEIERMWAFLPAMEHFLRKFRFYCEKHGTHEPKLEQKLAVDLEGNIVKNFFDNENAFLRGVVDISVRFASKPYGLVIDHKTGRERTLRYYAKQFLAYQILLKAHHPELTRIMSGVNWLKSDRIELGKFIDVPDVLALMNKFVAFLNEATQDCTDFSVYRTSRLCDWCDYKSKCPAFSSGTNADVVDQTEKEERNQPGTA